eukprot:scaffold113537_cov66-Phaeocystis_antarctica.AAC.3
MTRAAWPARGRCRLRCGGGVGGYLLGVAPAQLRCSGPASRRSGQRGAAHPAGRLMTRSSGFGCVSHSGLCSLFLRVSLAVCLCRV